jgi:hypothetical protein
MYFYHVSPSKNRSSIMLTGIDPLLATGNAAKVWVVDKSRIEWAIIHCSARHAVSVLELDVWAVKEPLKKPRRTSTSGVYTYSQVLHPETWRKAREYGLEDRM